MSVSIEFAGSSHPPVQLGEGSVLSEHLNALNSPLLFGCRMGICGTCVVRVHVLRGALPSPSDAERELLELVAPGEDRARLACQLTAIADLLIERFS
jgi:ferredoxin